MDHSAAYDIISHEILSKKLIHLGFHIATVKMIIDYLSNIKNYVEINTNKSSMRENVISE